MHVPPPLNEILPTNGDIHCAEGRFLIGNGPAAILGLTINANAAVFVRSEPFRGVMIDRMDGIHYPDPLGRVLTSGFRLNRVVDIDPGNQNHDHNLRNVQGGQQRPDYLVETEVECLVPRSMSQQGIAHAAQITDIRQRHEAIGAHGVIESNFASYC